MIQKTDTLLPMAVLDDIVGIAVFFTVNAVIARNVSGGTVSLLMIPVMIFLPIVVGAVIGLIAGIVLKKAEKKTAVLAVLLVGITITVMTGYWLNTRVFTNISLNYMLLGVSFSAAFSNLLPEEKLEAVTNAFQPILGIQQQR